MLQNQQKPDQQISLIAGMVTFLLIGCQVGLSAFLSSQSAGFLLNKIMPAMTANTIKKTALKMIAKNQSKMRLFPKMAAKLAVRTLVL
ncbi:hypothetical protein QUA56_19230 [Microcoleus sp. N3A4]|uniref:hypothetical protein n=1 Tax=Microcoleus sp. N3A4 TaxID=3055379 RepID=UPI002FCE831F